MSFEILTSVSFSKRSRNGTCVAYYASSCHECQWNVARRKWEYLKQSSKSRLTKYHPVLVSCRCMHQHSLCDTNHLYTTKTKHTSLVQCLKQPGTAASAGQKSLVAFHKLQLSYPPSRVRSSCWPVFNGCFAVDPICHAVRCLGGRRRLPRCGTHCSWHRRSSSHRHLYRQNEITQGCPEAVRTCAGVHAISHALRR